mmetsp:Transcript_6051/g.13386  ORF Transcript_6051/g.13386 Transcript_6051/m.13386 type:complete len:159 (+) Transcript_6051:692-1168(+)
MPMATDISPPPRSGRPPTTPTRATCTACSRDRPPRPSSPAKDDGNYMVPAPEEEREDYANSLFDWGRADGLPLDAETGLPAGGMTQFYRPGDGDAPGQFDIKGIRANEDGGLAQAWYDQNEPAANFGSTGRGKWPAGRSPSVMVMDGHVQMIDDGMRA